MNDEFIEITRPIRVLLHPKYLRHRLRKKHNVDEPSTMSTTTVEQLELAEEDNDEQEPEWLDEEETGHIDDDESEMETNQDDEQMEFIERQNSRESDDDEEMIH